MADEPANLTGLLGNAPPAAVWPLDYRNCDLARRLVRERSTETRLLAVVGFREFSLQATAAAAAEAALPWNSPTSIALVRRKDRCRQPLQAHGFVQPDLRPFASAADAAGFLAHCRLPMIVKPADSFGSQGVRLVSPDEDTAEALREAFANSSRILVEDYIDAPACSAEGIIIGGLPHILALTTESLTDPPYFATLSNALPDTVHPEQSHDICRQVGAAVSCVSLTHSLFHIEFFWTVEGVVLGEMHARPGGDWIHAMVAHHHRGLELFGLVLDDLLGHPTGPPELVDGAGAATSRAVLSPPGTVTRVDGEADARATPGSLAVDTFVAPGQVVAPLRDSFQRAALLVASGADLAQAQTRAQTIGRQDPGTLVDPGHAIS